MKPSIIPTYDSRETGPRYTVRTAINDVPLEEEPRKVHDPFVRHTVRIDWPRLLINLFTRRYLVVEVTIGADPDLMDDVLELDSNQLVPGRSRQVEFRGEMNQALRAFARGVDG